jgi:MGT family glycosyltransferase
MKDSLFTQDTVTAQQAGIPRKILFANVPGDGHFNPLTGLAKHLQQLGYDVRWYSSRIFTERLQKLQVPHYPFKRALDAFEDGFEKAFPGRDAIKSKIKKLEFDLVNGFILRSTEYFEDIKEIYATFPFDMVIADCAFMAIPFIKEKLKVPVISIGVLPLTESSKDLAPMGLGMTPATSFLGKRKQALLRFVANKIFFRKPNRLFARLLQEQGITIQGENLFDAAVRMSTLLLQIGTPGFEYKRSDMSKHVRFIGALLPHSVANQTTTWTHKKLEQYRNVIVVTQGTVEKDTTKLLEPALQAFRNTDYLLIVTTGGHGTKALQSKYQADNIIIEDFIPFADVMPFASVYITNGGYGGVMLGIQHQLPMVVAGVHEGKNEICARVGYFKIGINLDTEKPTAAQLQKSVDKIIHDTTYKINVLQLSMEFSRYNAHERCAAYVRETLFESGARMKLRGR